MKYLKSRMGVAAALFAAGAFALVPVAVAQENAAAAPTSKTARPMGKPAHEPDSMPMMDHMQTMAKLTDILEEAKGAAEAKGAETAVAKIDEALQILAKKHLEMHQHMAEMMRKKDEKVAEMQAMEQQMQKMKEEMSNSGQQATPSMQDMMQKMQQKMQHMREKMKTEEGAAEGMKCPICGMTIGAGAKVVNAACPMEGAPFDASKASDDQIRQFEGKSVGFCCARCATSWDRLDNAAKEKMLAAVTPRQGDGG